jgi:hypothetical protein
VHWDFLAIQQNSLPAASGGQNARETFPKAATYCHLLPLSMVERIVRPSDQAPATGISGRTSCRLPS